MNPKRTPEPQAAMGTFLVIWFGQLVSLLGSGLTGFSLGLWVLQQGGSVTQFALISVCTVVPGVLLSPLAGALVDRWDRRSIMLVSEFGAGLVTVVLAVLLRGNRLQLWEVYTAVSVISTLAAFQWPAFTASTTLLVPKAQLANASGLVQMAQGVARTAAPVLAGMMISTKALGIVSVLGADACSYAFSTATLLLVRFPSMTRTEDGAEPPSVMQDVRDGWSYLLGKPGLVALMLFLAAVNLVMGMIMVLVTPLVLSFASAATLGKVMSTAGVGMFVGSVLISIWGGPRRRMTGVYAFLLLSGISLIPAGLPASATLIGGGAFLFMLGIPVINGCIQACLQCKVPPDKQGRVFATTGMLATSAMPLAFAISGPLADRVFEPALARGGAWAAVLGPLVGTGPGRGVAFLFVLLGVSLVAMTIAGWSYRPLRRLEDELPDATTAPAPVSDRAAAAVLGNATVA